MQKYWVEHLTWEESTAKTWCSGLTETWNTSQRSASASAALRFTTFGKTALFHCVYFHSSPVYHIQGCSFLARNLRFNDTEYHLPASWSKNINILHQKPISAEPHCVQGWKSPQQIWCRSIWLHWQPVFQFTDWAGCCYVLDINLSVTTESIGSPWNSPAFVAS